MNQRPGTIFDAVIPDFDTPRVPCGDSNNIKECVVLRMHKVLVLGGSTIDCNCLPIFPDLEGGAYLPVGDEGYVNPLLMYRVAYKYFYQHYSTLSRVEYCELKKHIQSMYELGIKTGCQKSFWAETPIHDENERVCTLKCRPVITMQPGLHFPLSTNHGRYSAPGPAIRVGSKPGKVNFVPIFLPQSFFSGRGFVLPADDKSVVQKHLLYHLPKIFTNPF